MHFNFEELHIGSFCQCAPLCYLSANACVRVVANALFHSDKWCLICYSSFVLHIIRVHGTKRYLQQRKWNIKWSLLKKCIERWRICYKHIFITYKLYPCMTFSLWATFKYSLAYIQYTYTMSATCFHFEFVSFSSTYFYLSYDWMPIPISMSAGDDKNIRFRAGRLNNARIFFYSPFLLCTSISQGYSKG